MRKRFCAKDEYGYIETLRAAMEAVEKNLWRLSTYCDCYHYLGAIIGAGAMRDEELSYNAAVTKIMNDEFTMLGIRPKDEVNEAAENISIPTLDFERYGFLIEYSIDPAIRKKTTSILGYEFERLVPHTHFPKIMAHIVEQEAKITAERKLEEESTPR